MYPSQMQYHAQQAEIARVLTHHINLTINSPLFPCHLSLLEFHYSLFGTRLYSVVVFALLAAAFLTKHKDRYNSSDEQTNQIDGYVKKNSSYHGIPDIHESSLISVVPFQREVDHAAHQYNQGHFANHFKSELQLALKWRRTHEIEKALGIRMVLPQ